MKSGERTATFSDNEDYRYEPMVGMSLKTTHSQDQVLRVNERIATGTREFVSLFHNIRMIERSFIPYRKILSDVTKAKPRPPNRIENTAESPRLDLEKHQALRLERVFASDEVGSFARHRTASQSSSLTKQLLSNPVAPFYFIIDDVIVSPPLFCHRHCSYP